MTSFDVTGTLPNATNPIGNPSYPGNTVCIYVCKIHSFSSSTRNRLVAPWSIGLIS